MNEIEQTNTEDLMMQALEQMGITEVSLETLKSATLGNELLEITKLSMDDQQKQIH